jgi:hypothetical protein
VDVYWAHVEDRSVQLEEGAASLEDDPDGKLVDELSHKFTGGPYPGFAGPNPHG